MIAVEDTAPLRLSRRVDAAVTALVLAVAQPSASALSNDPTDPSAARSVRACGEMRTSGVDRKNFGPLQRSEQDRNDAGAPLLLENKSDRPWHG